MVCRWNGAVAFAACFGALGVIGVRRREGDASLWTFGDLQQQLGDLQHQTLDARQPYGRISVGGGSAAVAPNPMAMESAWPLPLPSMPWDSDHAAKARTQTTASASDPFPLLHPPEPGWTLPRAAMPWESGDLGKFQPHALPFQWKEHLGGFAYIPGSKDHLRVIAKGDASQRFVVKRVALHNKMGMADARREIENLAEMRGKPGVITFYASTVNHMVLGDEVYIVMEDAQGNLQNLVISKSMDKVKLGTRIRLFADILRAVAGMAKSGMVHRDLNPSNIVIVGDVLRDPNACSAVVCDFQHMCTMPDEKGSTSDASGFANPYFTAPEAQDKASPEQDVWSCGMLLFQMLTGHMPDSFVGLATAAEVRAHIQTSFRIEETRLHHELQGIVPELAALVQRMMDPDPRKRCTAEEALESLEADAALHGVDISPRARSPPPLPTWLEAWAPSSSPTPATQGQDEAAEQAKVPGLLGRVRNLAQRGARLRPGIFGRRDVREAGTLGGQA